MPLLIRLKCCESVRLPRFLGSTLHGVMGWILSRNNEEAYQYIFENRRYGGAKQDIVNPYILEPPRYQEIYYEGSMLCFKFTLLGKATHYTNSVVEALIRKVCIEIGVNRKNFELIDILQAETLETIWCSEISREPTPCNLMPTWEKKGVSRCSIHLITPLRIRRNGKQLREIDFPTIIRSITRRVTALTERYGGFVHSDAVSTVRELSSSVQTTSSGLYWSEIRRYSNRRNKKMDLSGLQGAMTFEGDMFHFAPWLYAAQYLHIGRNVTFGCGQLDVVFG